MVSWRCLRCDYAWHGWSDWKYRAGPACPKCGSFLIIDETTYENVKANLIGKINRNTPIIDFFVALNEVLSLDLSPAKKVALIRKVVRHVQEVYKKP